MRISNGLKSLLHGSKFGVGAFSPNDVKQSKQARYRKLMRGINVVSYSTFGILDACDRKFQLKKLELARDHENPTVIRESNVDFSFGKAIETGIQAIFLGKDDVHIWFDMFRAWDMPLDTQHPKNYNKTFMDACLLIDKFKTLKNALFQGWELAYFNDKPAVELAFILDMHSGYYYVGHVDIILYNPLEGKYKVLEIKTTARKYVHEAMYKNSDQATGYSIVLDSIASNLEQTNTFEVFYIVLLTEVEDNIKLFEFTKSRSMRAGWINTILLDIQRVNIYRKAGYFPKRGTACFDFSRPCEYLNICDLDATHFNPDGEFEFVEASELETYNFDFHFDLTDIIKTQEERLS